MERRELEQYIKEQCIPGGTKEACIKVREVLTYKMNLGNQLHASLSSVSIDEFIEAVEVLVAFAAQQPDSEVVTYGCDPDCVYAPNSRCKGKMLAGVDKTNIYSANTCPYYIMEDK